MKLHFIFNNKDDIVRLNIMPADVDDRKWLKSLLKDLMGQLFVGRGYQSENLFKELLNKDLIDYQDF